MFPGAMWDRAVATSFPARERGWPVKRARTCTCIGLRLSSCDQYRDNGSLAKTTQSRLLITIKCELETWERCKR